jgi:hypothetical protein
MVTEGSPDAGACLIVAMGRAPGYAVTAEKAIQRSEANAGPAQPGAPERTGQQGSLRRHRDFSKLWLGQAVSDFGSQVTVLALPLTAVIYLNATAAQVGLMTGAAQLAFLGPTLSPRPAPCRQE